MTDFPDLNLKLPLILPISEFTCSLVEHEKSFITSGPRDFVCFVIMLMHLAYTPM